MSRDNPGSPPVQQLTERLMVAKGLDYRIALKTLKFHLRSLDEVSFLSEMVRVTKIDIFPHLWAMGLSSKQQEIVTKRWEELTK